VNPNPFHDFVTYKRNSSDQTILTITDITGRNVFVQQLNGYSGKIDVSKFATGCYLAIFETENGQATIKKFIFFIISTKNIYSYNSLNLHLLKKINKILIRK